MAGIMKSAIVVLALIVCADVVLGQTCSATDEAALLYFCREFSYPGTAFDTWIQGTNCCGWKGVTCDGSGSVTELDIQNSVPVSPYPKGLLYFIGTGILGLKNLIKISIKNLAFNGALPDSWGTGLTKVQVLILEGNNIVSDFPQSLCNWKTMTTLSVANNLMTGPRPTCANNRAALPNLVSWNDTGNNWS